MITTCYDILFGQQILIEVPAGEETRDFPPHGWKGSWITLRRNHPAERRPGRRPRF